MTTVDQFLKALAIVESSDNPEAWGDAGRAMGRWQVHPDALWSHAKLFYMSPALDETWDEFVSRVLRALFRGAGRGTSPVEVAMRWHIGHWTLPGNADWDTAYANKFTAALAQAQKELP